MELTYRPNVCILLYNMEGKLLLGERHQNPGIFQFPQGGVEQGLVEESVYREIQEELGIPRDKVSITKKLLATHTYDFLEVPQYAVGKWRGQAQTFWLVEFLGDNTDIDLDAEHPEFMSYRWCTPKDVREVAEPRRLPGYEAPLKEVEDYFHHSLKMPAFKGNK